MSDPAMPAPAAPPPPPAPAATPMSNMMARFSTAELMLGGGALLILLTDIVFGMFGPYSFSNVIWTAAAFTVLLMVVTRFLGWSLPFSYETVLILAGLAAGLSGVRDLVYDLIYVTGQRNLEATFFLGMVGLYVGVALMAVGAWMMWRGRPAA